MFRILTIHSNHSTNVVLLYTLYLSTIRKDFMSRNGFVAYYWEESHGYSPDLFPLPFGKWYQCPFVSKEERKPLFITALLQNGLFPLLVLLLAQWLCGPWSILGIQGSHQINEELEKVPAPSRAVAPRAHAAFPLLLLVRTSSIHIGAYGLLLIGLLWVLSSIYQPLPFFLSRWRNVISLPLPVVVSTYSWIWIPLSRLPTRQDAAS